jgi:hypothetical protein
MPSVMMRKVSLCVDFSVADLLGEDGNLNFFVGSIQHFHSIKHDKSKISYRNRAL